MKRRLKLTPFAKILIVVLIILGIRYAYKSIDNNTSEIINIDKIIEKTKNIFKTESNNKKTNTSSKLDTVEINISENDSIIKIKSSGKTVFKRKKFNETDTFLFNISNEKELIGKIIYTKK